MRRCSWLLMSLACFSMLACNKPEIEECRRACWNHQKVMYWHNVDSEVKDMSPEDAAAIRAQREKDYQQIQERAEDPGLLNCITECQNNANTDQVKCLQEKTTAAGLEACLES